MLDDPGITEADDWNDHHSFAAACPQAGTHASQFSTFKRRLSSYLDFKPSASFSFDLIVKDTGVGMNPEQFESVFTEFAPSKLSVQRPRGGFGLGSSSSQSAQSSPSFV
jgi:signal transduction histidine kinase